MLSAASACFPSFLAYLVHDLSPVLVEFTDRLAIRYYGLAYILGFVIAYGFFVWAQRRGRSPLRANDLENLVSYLFFGVVLGGRIGYVLLYQTESLWRDPLYIFRVWEGGMASHGGFVGVVLAVIVFARRHGYSAFALGDMIVAAAPPGLFLGRVANFINGELWGRVTDVPWAVIFPEAQRPGIYDPAAFSVYSEQLERFVNPRHPSQLYEAALEGLALGIYMQLRFWGRGAAHRPAGQLVGEFLVVYGLVRVLGEVFREPDASLLLGVSRGIFYSGITIALGVGIILKIRSTGSSPLVRRMKN